MPDPWPEPIISKPRGTHAGEEQTCGPRQFGVPNPEISHFGESAQRDGPSRLIIRDSNCIHCITMMLPDTQQAPLQEHLRTDNAIYEGDLAGGWDRVLLPVAFQDFFRALHQLMKAKTHVYKLQLPTRG
jgi:hypothetical protein